MCFDGAVPGVGHKDLAPVSQLNERRHAWIDGAHLDTVLKVRERIKDPPSGTNLREDRSGTHNAEVRSLAAVEAEMPAEDREWTRRRLEQRMQELAEQNGGGFPLSAGIPFSLAIKDNSKMRPIEGLKSRELVILYRMPYS